MEHLQTLLDDMQLIANTLPTEQADVLETSIDILQMIRQWTNAYPTSIFPPLTAEDWDEHHRLLKDAKRSGSAAAADCMRYVVTRVGEVMEMMAKDR